MKQQLQKGDYVGSTTLVRRLCIDDARHYFCPSYAFALDRGLGVAQDRPEARRLFSAHCRDDPRSCSEFGSLYVAGLGMSKDLDMGQWLLELACRHRDPKGCRDLGLPPLVTRPRMLPSAARSPPTH